MISIDDHLNLNRILLLTIGLWPYQKSKFARLQLICCYSMLTTIIIFQLTTFVTSKCTVDLVIQVLSPTLAFIGVAILYISFNINNETIKYLMEQLRHICDDLKDNNEIAIVKQWSDHTKRYTVAFTMLIVCGMSFLIGIQLWPNFPNISSIKESRPRRLQIMTEYFVDQERYFYLLLLHVNVAFCITLVITVAIGSLFIAYLQYVCAMLQIASYRIDHAMQIYTVQGIILLSENMIYKKIICAIDIHRKAMMFSDCLMSRFEMLFTTLVGLTVITLSLNIFRVLHIVSFKYAKDSSLSFLIILFCFISLFLSNFIGQRVMDCNDRIFMTAYKIRWYITPIRIQKLILFLLQRGNKTFGLNVARLFVASIECFTTLLNASISYVTIMYSIGI